MKMSPASSEKRFASVSRKTNETDIQVNLTLDFDPAGVEEQEIKVSTGIGFLDHVRTRYSC